ncbi:hypothetical protein J2Y64_002983 [Aeromonas salmonicida]|nr:hypothetical protein [Aeromonas salmonicida]
MNGIHSAFDGIRVFYEFIEHIAEKCDHIQ